MSAAEAVRDLPSDEREKSEAELLDVLYEVLAHGVPAGSELTTAEVERFLHEHARSKKSVDEMLAFFRRYNLPTDAQAYGADPELRSLASGLHQNRGPMSPLPLDAFEPVASAPEESAPVRRALPQAAPLEEDSTVRTRMAQGGRAGGRGWAIAFAALGVCVAAGVGLGFQYGRQLEGDLRQARLQLRATDSALTSLEQRAERLRDALSQSEAERQALSGRLENFVAETERERAVEEDVLKRMLGKRYETLRAKAAAELAATSP